MATVISVHGTYAHDGNIDEAARRTVPGGGQWWQPGSDYEREMGALLTADDGTVEVVPFVWSGENSELARRQAGARLLQEMMALEKRREPYCVVGHSHGGSVVSAALLRAASKRQRLEHLKRWVTVGTPFVRHEREQLLFARLDLMSKVFFVASGMLLMMFLVYLLTELLAGETMLFGRTFPGVLLVTGAMMSLPALLFYVWVYTRDSNALLNYRERVVSRARDYFSSRWLSLAHPEDEAIQGLGLMRDAKLSVVDRSFAVSSITMLSVFALPLAYVLLLASPAAMLGLANWLKTEVYEQRASPGTIKALEGLRRELADKRRAARKSAAETGQADAEATRQERRARWIEYRERRKELIARHPDLNAAERAERFRGRFFERDERPCEGGQLCGAGRDLRINSALLLHVVTDELSWAIGGDALVDSPARWLFSLALPAVLVPVIFGLLALAVMMAIRAVASLVSALLSRLLNMVTSSEVRRAAYGNDTEGEIAVDAGDRPVWIERSPPRLPAPLSAIVTAYSDAVAVNSLSKFRRAIGEFASSEQRHIGDGGLSGYFTWKELVHSAYFDVPEFRKLVAQVVSRAEGFAPSPSFRADPDFERTAAWLDALAPPLPAAQVEAPHGAVAASAAPDAGAAEAGSVPRIPAGGAGHPA